MNHRQQLGSRSRTNRHSTIARALRGSGLLLLAACAGRTAESTPGATRSTASTSRLPVVQQASLATSTGNLAGSIQLPASRAPFPVVLIIAGSGPTDRDGNTPALPGTNNSLKLLAEGLAAQGIATLRFDKRGVGASATAATTEAELRFTNYVDDAAAWARQLRADPRFSTLTIVGHSEGSLIGMVAAKQAGVDGLVSIAGAGRRPPEIISEQLAAQLSKEIVARAQDIMKQIESGGKPDSIPPVLQPLFRPSVQPYLVSWFKFDPVVEIAALDIPALIVQGTTDLQIGQADARRLASAYPAGRLVIVEGMNHVLKAAPADRQQQMRSYMDPTLPVVPLLVSEVAAFVHTVKRKAPAP